MSASVDLHILDYRDLVRRLGAIGVSDREKLGQILAKFGVMIGDKFVILDNEHSDENPFWEAFRLIDMTFGTEDSLSAACDTDGWRKGINHADAERVAEQLGITIGHDI